MDTDNLTDMAYQTIILANEATDVLKCELGVLCGKFKSENEYLNDFLLNKHCRFCPVCDLIIAKRDDVESMMAERIGREKPQLVGNDYLVFGTLDRKDWMDGQKLEMSPLELMNRVYVFRDTWTFEIVPGGWFPPG
jgi:hypothetical protein